MNKRTRRVRDDNGSTRSAWVPMDNLNAQDLWGFHVIHGRGGRARGRPRLALAELSPAARRKRLARAAVNDLIGESGRYYFGYEPSTPDDWARERREREEALAACRRQALAIGPF